MEPSPSLHHIRCKHTDTQIDGRAAAHGTDTLVVQIGAHVQNNTRRA
jgi:hypothetical protein